MPLVCLLAGGRSERMGRDKAGLYRMGIPQLQWLITLAVEVVGPRVITLGTGVAGCDYYLDRGEGPAQALREAASTGALGDSGVVLVLPVDLFSLDETGLRWMTREVVRSPAVLVVDEAPSYATFGVPIGLLRANQSWSSLRSITISLRRLGVPEPLKEQFRDSDYPWQLPATVHRR